MYVPRIGEPIAAAYVRLHELARTLRERCPWDIEQTHASLVPHLVEETFELVDALAALDPDDPTTDEALIEELGDVLYQVEFHAVIAEQAGRFSMADVTTSLHDKLVLRHPHVFGDVEAADADAVKPTGTTSSGTRRSARPCSTASRRRCRRWPTASTSPARRPRSASTGPTSTVRWPRSTRSWPSYGRPSTAASRIASPTSSATC